MRRDGRPYGERREWTAPAGYGFDVERPIAGFYKIKRGQSTIKRGVHLVFGPPKDPVTGEVMDRSWRWMAYLDDGSLAEFSSVWPACAGDPISESDFQYMLKRREWAQEHAPDSAYAVVGKKYDPLDPRNPLPF